MSTRIVSISARMELVRGIAFHVGERYTDLKYLGEGVYGVVVSARRRLKRVSWLSCSIIELTIWDERSEAGTGWA